MVRVENKNSFYTTTSTNLKLWKLGYFIASDEQNAQAITKRLFDF